MLVGEVDEEQSLPPRRPSSPPMLLRSKRDSWTEVPGAAPHELEGPENHVQHLRARLRHVKGHYEHLEGELEASQQVVLPWERRYQELGETVRAREELEEAQEEVQG